MNLRCILLVAVLSACAPRTHPGGLEPVVTERLYFGRNVGSALGVTDSAWAVFLREVVSSRLEGFTFWSAEGAWRGNREPSFVLEIIHPEQSPGTDSAVAAIIVEYKRRFSQESVLRVVTPGRRSL